MAAGNLVKQYTMIFSIIIADGKIVHFLLKSFNQESNKFGFFSLVEQVFICFLFLLFYISDLAS